jgi:hypothetical protein
MREYGLKTTTDAVGDSSGQQKPLPADAAHIKDMLLEVIHSALFQSGVLEKFVARALDQRLEKDIIAIVQREIQVTLSSENVKVLIDDKFRAISLYLKQEVIPKAVAQILKGSKQLA